jgi:putative endonuclease
MTYFVYILQSQKTLKFYCGQTDNLEQRLNRHNGAEVKSTKHGIPWIVIAVVPCASRVESMELELKIKKEAFKDGSTKMSIIK